MATPQAAQPPVFVVTLLVSVVLVALLFFVGTDAPLAFFGVGGIGALLIAFLAQRFTPSVAAVPAPPTAPAPKPAPPALPPATPAIQLLSLFQREGRLVDFLQEDLRAYDDAQIGAAVRNVHEGCRKVLAEHVALEPIYAAAEGSRVTIAPGFDARTVRLTGNVVGEPPFEGTLQHRGWRVQRVDLPALTSAQGQDLVVAAAEVEV